MRASLPICLLALLFAEMSYTFEIATIYSAQRALIEEFGDPVLFGWLVTSPMIVGAAVAAVIGRLGDLYGRLNLLIGVLLIGSLGSVVGLLSDSYATLLIGRTLQGFTHAAMPLCIGLVREHFPEERVSFGIGLVVSSATAGSALGLVAGGMLVDMFSWRAVFGASAVFGAVASLLLKASFRNTGGTGQKLDVNWISGLLFVPGIVLVLMALSNGPAWGIFDWKTLSCATAGTLLVIWWAIASLRAENPLISVRLLGIREFLFANLSFAFICMGAMQFILVFSLLMQSPVWTGIGLGVSATLAGLVKLPSNVSSLAAGPLGAWLIERLGARGAMMLGGATTLSGWMLALFLHDSVLEVGAILAVISFGSTMLFALLPIIIAKSVSIERTSEAIGVSAVVRGIATSIGVQIVSLLLASSQITGPNGARFPSSDAFMVTFIAIAGMCAMAVILALPLSGRPMKADELCQEEPDWAAGRQGVAGKSQ